MKKLLPLFPLFALSCFAQTGNTIIVNFPGAPSGTCAPIMVAVNSATGEYFDCLSGSWNSVGGTGGGITIDTTTITGGGANRILFESATNKVSESASITMNPDVSVSGPDFFYVNGGSLTMNSTATANGLDGGNVWLIPVTGGNTTIATTGTGGTGGGVYVYPGNGGAANSAAVSSTGGAGGSIDMAAGSGGQSDAVHGAGANIGGAGADITFATGNGGNASNGLTNTGGNAGNFGITLGAGGTGSTANGTDGAFRINGASTVFTFARSGYYQMPEVTAPSAPAANNARIYVQDNGAGKTQVCALFSSGAAQCFATQP